MKIDRNEPPRRLPAPVRARQKSQPTPYSRHCHNPSSHDSRSRPAAPETGSTHRPALRHYPARRRLSWRGTPRRHYRATASHDTAMAHKRSLKHATRCLTLSLAAPPGSYRHKAALSPTLADANYSGFCIRIELSLFYMPVIIFRNPPDPFRPWQHRPPDTAVRSRRPHPQIHHFPCSSRSRPARVAYSE